MSYPITLNVTIDFSSGAVFGTTLVLGSPTYGQLGYNVLGDAASEVVDISDIVGNVKLSGGYNLLQDQFEATTGTVRLYDQNGDWNPENPASPYAGKLVPNRKIRVSATYNGVTYWIFSGYTSAYNYSYPKNQEIAYLDIAVSDAFRLFNLSNITTVASATAGQDTGTRIGKILDQITWPSSMRSIDTGLTTCQADPSSARTALQALKNAEFTEQGAFFIDPQGNATFYSRQTVQEASGQTPVYFSNAGDGINYWNITTVLDDKLVINQSNITRIGGTTQTASDADSIAKYFPHTMNQSNLIAETDAQCLDIAKIYVATRKDTSLRVDNITLDLTTPNYNDGIIAALSLQYFDPVTIRNDQQGGTYILKTLEVLGSAVEITPTQWRTTFTTAEPIVDGFILNNATFGVLGTGVLTY